MTPSTNSQNQTLQPLEVPQDSLGKIVLMFAWPAAWFTLLIYVIGRQFIPDGGRTPTWLLLLIIVLGTGAELVAGLFLLRREGYPLRIRALRERIRWSWPKGGKAWTLAVIVFILGMSLSMAMGPVNRALASVPGFVPPDWWGAASNPTIRVTGAADVFPDINLGGNYLFVLLYFFIGLVLGNLFSGVSDSVSLSGTRYATSIKKSFLYLFVTVMFESILIHESE